MGAEGDSDFRQVEYCSESVHLSCWWQGEPRAWQKGDGFRALLCRLLNVQQRKLPDLCMGCPDLGAVVEMGYRATCLLGGKDITSFSFLRKRIW